MPVQCRSISRRWQDVTIKRLKAFVGVIINMRNLTLTNTRSTGLLPPNYQFLVVFSRDRFILQICWILQLEI